MAAATKTTPARTSTVHARRYVTFAIALIPWAPEGGNARSPSSRRVAYFPLQRHAKGDPIGCG